MILVSLLLGCAAKHHEESHDYPAHRPENFRQAVDSLLQRDEKLRVQFDQQQNEQLLDILRWLPEIAAETDLPEATWNRVNQVAQTARQAYETNARKNQLPPKQHAESWLDTLREAAAECVELERSARPNVR